MNTLAIGQNLMLPYENLETENKDLCKRFEYIQKYKEATWLRWRKEYTKSFRERQNMKTKDPISIAKVREVVVFHSSDIRIHIQFNSYLILLHTKSL